MPTRYLRAAKRKARYHPLEDDAGYYGEIPGLDGVWPSAKTVEACRERLQEVLEEWILFRVSKHLEVPVVDEVELKFSEMAPP